jgi:hypothetical protein
MTEKRILRHREPLALAKLIDDIVIASTRTSLSMSAIG